MFYLEVIDKKYINPHLEEGEGFIEVDDDIENFDLYYFNTGDNTIKKRTVIDYIIEPKGNDVSILFNTPKHLIVSVSYSNTVNETPVSANQIVYVESVDGVGELVLSMDLTGTTSISSIDPDFFFERFYIDAEKEVDNEYDPHIVVKGNHVGIYRSVGYMRLLSLQKEIDSLKKILDDNGLVAKDE